jgi:uncharacterized OB-fold protein
VRALSRAGIALGGGIRQGAAHQLGHDYFAGRLPYNVAVVELAEGPRLISNVIAAHDRLRIDMELKLAIQREAGVALARFVPA